MLNLSPSGIARWLCLTPVEQCRQVYGFFARLDIAEDFDLTGQNLMPIDGGPFDCGKSYGNQHGRLSGVVSPDDELNVSMPFHSQTRSCAKTSNFKGMQDGNHHNPESRRTVGKFNQNVQQPTRIGRSAASNGTGGKRLRKSAVRPHFRLSCTRLTRKPSLFHSPIDPFGIDEFL